MPPVSIENPILNSPFDDVNLASALEAAFAQCDTGLAGCFLIGRRDA